MRHDVIILGGGAAGILCAIEAGKRGKSVLVLEHNDRLARKIRISGGGRCNFTNLEVSHRQYLSENPKFCISALRQFPPEAFIGMVERHRIAYYEKEAGQLFCRESSEQIIAMLAAEAAAAGVEIRTGCRVLDAGKEEEFFVKLSGDDARSHALVLATGGLSVPSVGATDLGYVLARRFGLGIVPTRPGLVPFLWNSREAGILGALAGVSCVATLTVGTVSFTGDILFTAKGLSGPAALQISSYWREGEAVFINFLPSIDLPAFLKKHHQKNSTLVKLMEGMLPRRLLKILAGAEGDVPVCQVSRQRLGMVEERFVRWSAIPKGTEGYAKAEVTCGGIDTRELSSRTMESKRVPGLYCVGEVVDVTGWLGGYNAQWAWSSGFAAGRNA